MLPFFRSAFCLSEKRIRDASCDQFTLRREALEAGATDFLPELMDAAEVRARVSNLLALSQPHRALRDHATQLDREVPTAVGLLDEHEREIVSSLMCAAKNRDGDTGDHSI